MIAIVPRSRSHECTPFFGPHPMSIESRRQHSCYKSDVRSRNKESTERAAVSHHSNTLFLRYNSCGALMPLWHWITGVTSETKLYGIVHHSRSAMLEQRDEQFLFPFHPFLAHHFAVPTIGRDV